MKSKIIVDTSIWINYFKGDQKTAAFLEENLVNDLIYINGIIIAELLQGVKTEKEFGAIRECIDAVSYLELTYKDWLLAGSMSNTLRKKGITIPLTDLAVGASAINNKLQIATLDRHYGYIPELMLYNEE